jgi:hypothetical protein
MSRMAKDDAPQRVGPTSAMDSMLPHPCIPSDPSLPEARPAFELPNLPVSLRYTNNAVPKRSRYLDTNRAKLQRLDPGRPPPGPHLRGTPLLMRHPAPAKARLFCRPVRRWEVEPARRRSRCFLRPYLPSVPGLDARLARTSNRSAPRPGREWESAALPGK